MNDQIRKLLAESGLLDYTKIVVPEHQKFAELIVREFAYDCMDATGQPDHVQFVAKKWGVEL